MLPTLPESQPYPLSVDVPYEPFASRLRGLFRIVLGLPLLLFLNAAQQVAGLLSFFAWWAIVLTGRYPTAMWRFNITFVNWIAAGCGYLGLLADDYPPLGPGTYGIRARSRAYPAAAGEESYEDMPPPRSSRWRVGLRALLILPQFLALILVNIAGFGGLIVQWFAVVIAGHRPEGLTSFLSAVLRWNVRVLAYWLLLRDEYPPYNGAATAPATGHAGERTALALGGLLAAGLVALVVVSILNQPAPITGTTPYQAAVAGDVNNQLLGAQYDPPFADGSVFIYFTGGGGDPPPDRVEVDEGNRLVKFTWRLINRSTAEFETGDFDMRLDAGGGDVRAD